LGLLLAGALSAAAIVFAVQSVPSPEISPEVAHVATPVAGTEASYGRAPQTSASQPSAAELAYRQGLALLREKRAVEALPQFERCLVQEPRSVDCWWEKGWAHWLQEDWISVVQAWEQTQDLEPEHEEVAEWLPAAWRRLGEVVTRRDILELGHEPVRVDVSASPGLETVVEVSSEIGPPLVEIRADDGHLLARLGEGIEFSDWSLVDAIPDSMTEILEYRNCACSMNMGGFRVYKLYEDGPRVVWDGGGDAGGGEVMFFGSTTTGVLMHEVPSFVTDPRCEVKACSNAELWILDRLNTRLFSYDPAKREFLPVFRPETTSAPR